MHISIKFLGLVCLLVSLSSYANAQEDLKTRERKKLPKSGVLSESVTTGGSVSERVPEPWGGTDLQGQEAPPISGSVSRISKDKWMMRVFNNSADSFSVSLSVDQFNAAGRKVKSDSYSYTLKAGQTAEREIDSASNTESCSLQLRSWKNLTAKKTTATPTPGGA